MYLFRHGPSNDRDVHRVLLLRLRLLHGGRAGVLEDQPHRHHRLCRPHAHRM